MAEPDPEVGSGPWQPPLLLGREEEAEEEEEEGAGYVLCRYGPARAGGVGRWGVGMTSAGSRCRRVPREPTSQQLRAEGRGAV